MRGDGYGTQHVECMMLLILIDGFPIFILYVDEKLRKFLNLHIYYILQLNPRAIWTEKNPSILIVEIDCRYKYSRFTLWYPPANQFLQDV